MHKTREIAFLAALAFGLAPSLVLAQTAFSPRSTNKQAAVEYLFPEQIAVPAGKSTAVALHFRVAPGLHINSHTPKEEELIPTVFAIPADSGVRLEAATYPPGADFTLPLDPAAKLSVYTGEFIIDARIVAAKGDHLVEASLRFQACDQNACMPPKTITVAIDVVGR
jgi:hypothetical protein